MTIYDQIAFSTRYRINVMQLVVLLHKFLKKELPMVHKKRLNNLMEACKTAVKSSKLYLTGLGRGLVNNNTTRSNIQKMDRLLGNSHLQREHMSFYKVMASTLIKEHATPILHIDWSCINSVTNLYVLRASLSMTGRSIVIYEETHPKKNENNHNVHKQFLNNLCEMLPKSVKPIIVTDAGFRGIWFAYIQKLGWDFVGRLRNKNLVCLTGESTWQLSSAFYEKATGTPICLGSGLLTKKGQVSVNFILYKGKRKNRHKLNKNKTISSGGHSKKYSVSHKEPWVLVTSLSLNKDIAKRTTNIYKQRMRIEENFRDTKCPHYGLGLRKSLSRTPKRMSILLLIAALSTFAAWLSGLFSKKNGKASNFQAHSAKFTSALSKIYLGREALKKGFHMTKKQFISALDMLYQDSLTAQNETFT